jgi:outer membrane receptor protein involved in Fe transport
LWLTTDERNRALKPLRSDHWIAGIEYLLQDDLRSTIDFYYKRYSQYPVSGYIPSFILVNGGAEPGAFLGGDLRSVGTGFARGVEVFLQKKLTRDYYGTVSYSLYETRFRALDGIERRGNFDYRHVVTLVAGYKFSPSFELSAKWRYTGGRPYTPISPELSRLVGREALDLTRVNAERYPPYHRLDVRGDYRFSLGSWDLVIYLDLQNAYNQKNIYYHLWDDTKKEIVTAYQWSLLPVFGLSAEL